jgi:2-dehydropantoate 2-reductase
MDKTKILIEGVGGIGGIVAGRLIHAGHEPVLVTHNPKITEVINEGGLRIKTPEEERVVQAKAHTALDEVTGDAPFDVAFLIMKATAVLDAARETLPLLDKESGYMVTFQNGIVEDAVAEVVGAERVVSGIIGWGGTMLEPGNYEKTSGGEIHMGELDGRRSERVQGLASILETVCPVVVSENIRGALWSKLAINCTITTMGALTGETLGEMLADERVRRAFLRVYREVVDTADALGIEMERIAANPRLLYLPRDAGWLTRFFKDLLARMVGRKYSQVKSSSLQSLERGRRTEIDYLNGYVVERAREAGVDVPLNEALVRIIKEIEAKDRVIGPENMADLLTLLE